MGMMRIEMVDRRLGALYFAFCALFAERMLVCRANPVCQGGLEI
jgi:hypothetical protein